LCDLRKESNPVYDIGIFQVLEFNFFNDVAFIDGFKDALYEVVGELVLGERKESDSLSVTF